MKIVLLILASLAFAFFILCPRMVGMSVVIADVKGLNPYMVVFIGAVLAIPLFGLMFFVLKNFGVEWALGLAVLTDVLAALLVGIFGWKSTYQIIVIATFLWVGIVVAEITSKILFPS
ncbi:hypothetical protein CW703_02330 [Candidatus Bathyarchaeota archaeon]|nr:MAG: hypothetical protein CW703_02330 [Candidatus Bathyarchaeota archaeon]